MNTENIEIDISDETFLILAKIAHEKDITFNQLVNEILLQEISNTEHSMNLKEEFKKIDEHFASIPSEELLADLIKCGLTEEPL